MAAVTVRSRARALPALAILATALAGTTSSPALAGGDAIFRDGFDPLLRLLPYLVPTSMQCTFPGVAVAQDQPARLCFHVTNLSDTLRFTHHRIEDDQFGVVSEHDFPLEPSESRDIESDLGPVPVSIAGFHRASWTATGPDHAATTSAVFHFGYDPAVRLLALIVGSAADCAPGIADANAFASGLTHVTVAPGTPLAACYRAVNVGATQIREHRLVDTALGVLLEDAPTWLGQRYKYSVGRPLDSAASSTFSGTWSAGNDAGTTHGTAEASVTVVADPGCSGVSASSTIDYALALGGVPLDPPYPAGIRLDMDVSATPARAGEDFTLVAQGRMPEAASFDGRRDNTTVVVKLPPGIDLARPPQVQASLNGDVPMRSRLDVAARTLTLDTGPVDGAPGTVDLTITARADGSANPLRFEAPSIALHYASSPTGSIGGVPGPDAPPVLTVPLCTP